MGQRLLQMTQVGHLHAGEAQDDWKVVRGVGESATGVSAPRSAMADSTICSASLTIRLAPRIAALAMYLDISLHLRPDALVAYGIEVKFLALVYIF